MYQRRRRPGRRGTLLGPAFVAAIAYVDPGNVATNISAGTQYGYLLVWVLVAANLMAGLVQFLSARLGLLTGESLPRLVGDRLGRRGRLAYWVQAELVAVATDLAEIVGGALALAILFDLPLVVGALVTTVVSTGILFLQDRGQRGFERVITAMLAIIAVGFLAGLVVEPPSPAGIAGGLVPRFDGAGSVLLAAGMLGATVMPHAVYLHSALARDRHGRAAPADADRLLRATRTDIVLAMLVAGATNLGMLLLAAAALQGRAGTETLEGVHEALGLELGEGVALMFALALLASGLASTAVGSYSGAVVMEGLLQRRIPLLVRRVVTAVPAVVVLAAGADPTQALVLSQVVLSFGIPFALVPLVRLNRDPRVVGDRTTHRATTAAAWVVVAVVVALNLALVVLTVADLAAA